MPVLNHFKEFLNFNRSERSGLIVLFILLIIIITINRLLPFLITHKASDFSSFEQKIEEFEKQQKFLTDSIKAVKNQKFLPKKLTPFLFDPNQLSEEKWIQLGLSENQVKNIMNYKKAGGEFKKPYDLKKIYSISSAEFKQLEPFILIKSSPLSVDSIRKKELIPFDFNPNTCSEDTLYKLGLGKHLVKSILKYRKKGGKFFTKKDFSKMYGLDPNDYKILEPYIVITLNSNINKRTQTNRIIEINGADTLELQELNGIGPSFARRIIKYRELLGGFYKPDQLLEVYGMDSIRIAGFIENISINQERLVKISINKAGLKELKRHPYIDYHLAKSIIEYRTKKGIIKNQDEWNNSKLAYSDLLKKISPYLKFK